MAGSEDNESAQGADGRQRVGRYAYVEELGDGALGTLWSAQVVAGAELGRNVVIRRLAREALDDSAVERLTMAGFAAMEVRHPKICAVLDIQVASDEIAVVSESVEGVRLRSLLPGGAARPICPPKVALRIALDVLEALAALGPLWDEVSPEEEGAEGDPATNLYGGVLPDALLIASFGETMITDVGVSGTAVAIDAIRDQPPVLAYRAPEQLERPADPASDVFSVGILLHELIANRPLFGSIALPRPGASRAAGSGGAGQASAIRRRLSSAPIPRLDALPLSKKSVSKGLADVVARALDRDPKKRFSDARVMIEALRQLGDDAIGTHEDVSAHVEKVCGGGDDETVGPDRIDSDADVAVSNRPTIPPQSTRSTAPPAGIDPEATRPGLIPLSPVATPVIQPAASVGPSEPPESIEPEPLAESEEPMAESVESVEPSSAPEQTPERPPPRPPPPRVRPVVAPPAPFVPSSVGVTDGDGTTDLTAADENLRTIPVPRTTTPGWRGPAIAGAVAAAALIAFVVGVYAFGESPEDGAETAAAAPATAAQTAPSATVAPRSPGPEAKSAAATEAASPATPEAAVAAPVASPPSTPAETSTATAPPPPTPAPAPVQPPVRRAPRAAPRPPPEPEAPKPTSTGRRPFRPSGL